MENVCRSGSQDGLQAASAEKLRHAEFVQLFVSAAGQVGREVQSVLATASTESDLHVSAICHQQNHLQRHYKSNLTGLGQFSTSITQFTAYLYFVN